MICLAAMDDNRGIGFEGELPWPSIKADFKWFKEVTMGKVIIVGNTTKKFLPQLPGRIVFTLSKNWRELGHNEYTVNDIGSIPDLDNAVLCGGGSIYKQFLPQCTDLYLTKVKGCFKSDTYMPEFEHLFKLYETKYSDNQIEIQHWIRI